MYNTGWFFLFHFIPAAKQMIEMVYRPMYSIWVSVKVRQTEEKKELPYFVSTWAWNDLKTPLLNKAKLDNKKRPLLLFSDHTTCTTPKTTTCINL